MYDALVTIYTLDDSIMGDQGVIHDVPYEFTVRVLYYQAG